VREGGADYDGSQREQQQKRNLGEEVLQHPPDLAAPLPLSRL